MKFTDLTLKGSYSGYTKMTSVSIIYSIKTYPFAKDFIGSLALFALSILSSISCTSQISATQRTATQIEVSIPTIEQEATSIWRTINDITFLEEQGYTINLPKNEVIQALITKSKNKEFGNDDFPTIYSLLESNIYDNSKYESALKKVKTQEDLIISLVTKLKQTSNAWNWDFKQFDTYSVVFTLYGTGGSYNEELGLVTLFTNEEGSFMNYDNPANTILHEIVHMGIENSIVQKYNLPHGSKERIVDTITFLLFKNELKDYKIQNMGDTKIDDYLKTSNDLINLNSLIEQYLNKK